MKKQRCISFLAVCSVFVVSMALQVGGCKPKQPQAPAKTEVIVGYLPVSTTLPNWVAKAEKFAEARDLKVKFKRYANSNVLLMGLMSGEVHTTSVCADEPILSAISKGQKGFEVYLQEVLTTDRVFDAIIAKKDSSLRSVSDLEGKTIACFPGSQLKAYLGIILREAGVKTESVKIIQLPPPNMIPSLISGTVDACFALEPIITVATKKGIAKVIAASPICEYVNGGTPLCAASYLVSSKWADENPKAADAFVRSVYDAIRLIRDDYARASEYYPEFAPIPEEMAGSVVITDFATIDSPDLEGLRKAMQVLYDADVIKSIVPVDQLIYKWRSTSE